MFSFSKTKMAQPEESTSTKHQQTSAMSMMGDITDFFETQMQALCTLSESMITMDRFGTDFVSMIKMDGKPIPPPLMTPERLEEMQRYKQQAIELEAKLNLHRKKKLLSRVQAIVDGIDERRTPTPRDISTPDCSPVLPDDSLQNQDSGMGSSYTQPTSESREKFSSTPIDRLGDTKEDLETNNDDSGNVSGQTILHLDATATDDLVVVGYRSTSSSSDISELNRTVIAANESDDSLPNSSGSSQTVTEKAESQDSQSRKSVSSDNEGTISPRSSVTEEKHESEANREDSGSEIFSEDNAEENREEDAHHDFPPVSDTESALSLIGDYKPLPTPASLQTPDPSAVSRPDSVPSLPDSSPIATATASSTDEASDAEQWMSTGEAETHDEDPKQLISTGSSDLMTYGSAAHSCSLPISCVTDSVDTLRDIKESMDAMNDDVLSAVSEEDAPNVRGAPVGQERGDEQWKSAVPGSTSVSNDTVAGSSSTGDDVSPLQTVRRRGSYTLDEPSPALLRAQSDREDSYEKEKLNVSGKSATARRSLEFTREGENREDNTTAKAEVAKETEKKNQGKVLKKSEELTEKQKPASRDASSSSQRDASRNVASDHLLGLRQQQMDYFEQLRTQLHEQQQQQLQEVLLQQQREQMVLQREFEEQEKRFEEEQRMLMEQVARRYEKTENEQWLDKLNQLRSLEGRGDSDSESNSSKRSNSDSLRDSPLSRLEKSPALPPASYRPHTAEPAFMKYPFYLEGQIRHDTSADTSHSPSSMTSSPQLSVSTPLMSSSPRTKALVRKVASRDMKHKFEMVSAAVKGYLTRRLLRTEKVQAITKTIKDTYSFVYRFQEETPVKRGNLSMQDTKLAERVIAQLRSALLDMHEIFFEIPVYERMAIINHDRLLEDERRLLKKQKQDPSKKLVSDATKKVMERRKQVKVVSAPQSATLRPKTAPPSVSTMKKTPFDARVLKPIQGVESPRRPADHLYRPAKYASKKQENRPKTAPEKIQDNPTMQPVGSKVGIHSTSTTVTAKSKGARRSLYPVSAVTSKARPKSPRGKTTKRKV